MCGGVGVVEHVGCRSCVDVLLVGLFVSAVASVGCCLWLCCDVDVRS